MIEDFLLVAIIILLIGIGDELCRIRVHLTGKKDQA